MHVGGLPVSEIMAQAGSPVYAIDEIDFRGRALTWAQAFSGWKVYYAGKSFLSGTIARWVSEEGLNLDVCSLGELTVALREVSSERQAARPMRTTARDSSIGESLPARMSATIEASTIPITVPLWPSRWMDEMALGLA